MLSKGALLIIIAVVVAAVSVGAVVATQSVSDGNPAKGRQLSIDLNENLALKGNP